GEQRPHKHWSLFRQDASRETRHYNRRSFTESGDPCWRTELRVQVLLHVPGRFSHSQLHAAYARSRKGLRVQARLSGWNLEDPAERAPVRFQLAACLLYEGT